MKKVLIGLVAGALIGGLVSGVSATPITFNIGGADDGSSVSVFETVRKANLSAALVDGLDAESFTLGDGDSWTMDFFTLTVSGFGGGAYSIQATLAIEDPKVSATGSGLGSFFTVWGLVSGGKLDWQGSVPDAFTLSDGNTISIDFEEGCLVQFGKTTTIQATITNLGGGATPVPEPTTLLLLGAGLVGLAVSSRRKSRKN